MRAVETKWSLKKSADLKAIEWIYMLHAIGGFICHDAYIYASMHGQIVELMHPSII
jgi:hypothetical protein